MGLALVAAVVAGVAVRTTSRSPQAERLWWLAALVASGTAAAAQEVSPVPTAVGLAAGGIVAAATVDAAEGRVPTVVAHGTTAVSLASLAVYAHSRGDWSELVGGPVVFAALLAGACTLFWALGTMGFGDVRLAAATITALVSGAEGAMLVLWCAFVASGLAVVALRLVGRRPGHLPFGPGLALGWLVAILVA